MYAATDLTTYRSIVQGRENIVEQNRPDEEKKTSFIKETVLKRPRSWRDRLKIVLWILVIGALFGAAAGGAFYGISRLAHRDPEPAQTAVFTLPSEEGTHAAQGGETQPAQTDPAAQTEPSGEPVTEEETQAPETTAPDHGSGTEEASGGAETLPETDEAWRDRLLGETAKSFVTVQKTVTETDVFGQSFERKTQCSGVIVGQDKDAYLILAPYAPIANAERLSVRFFEYGWADAQIAGRDTLSDLTVLKVVPEASFGENEPQPVRFGNSRTLSAGQKLLAVGSPYGIEGTAAVGRVLGTTQEETAVDGALQIVYTDMGASREGLGFVLDEAGRLTGLLTSQYAGSGDGFLTRFLGISDARSRIQTLCQGRSPAYLGVRTVTVEGNPEQEGAVAGQYITEVLADSPAYRSGLQAGDILTKIGRTEILTAADLMSALSAAVPDAQVQVTVQRRGRDGYTEITYETALGSR